LVRSIPLCGTTSLNTCPDKLCIAVTSMPTNPAATHPGSPTVIDDPYQTSIQAQPGALPRQQSFPVQHAGIVPQWQETSPGPYLIYPGQQGVVAPDKNAAQVAQTSHANSQYKTAAPIAALGRSPAPVDCPSCGQRALTTTSFVVGNTAQYVYTLKACGLSACC
jgi:hypothetical protein